MLRSPLQPCCSSLLIGETPRPDFFAATKEVPFKGCLSSVLPLALWSCGLSAGQVPAIDLWLGEHGSTLEQREAFNNVRRGYGSLIMDAPVSQPGHGLSLPHCFYFPGSGRSYKMPLLPPIGHVLAGPLLCRIWGSSGGWKVRAGSGGRSQCMCML